MSGSDDGYQYEYDDEYLDDEVDPREQYRRRKRRRTLITLGVLLAVLFGGAWYAWSYYKGPATASKPKTTAACVAPDPKAIRPETTKVNVYNATTRNGIAAAAAKALGDDGWIIGKVSNDPLKRSVKGAAEVRFGPAGEARAKLLAPRAGEGVTLVKDPKRKGAEVDLVLGAGWVSVVPATGTPLPPLCPADASPTAST